MSWTSNWCRGVSSIQIMCGVIQTSALSMITARQSLRNLDLRMSIHLIQGIKANLIPVGSYVLFSVIAIAFQLSGMTPNPLSQIKIGTSYPAVQLVRLMAEFVVIF
jgi:hypothetical protein